MDDIRVPQKSCQFILIIPRCSCCSTGHKLLPLNDIKSDMGQITHYKNVVFIIISALLVICGVLFMH